MDQVAQRIYAVIGTVTGIDVEGIRPQDRLRQELGLDRVGKLELISAMAEEFQLDVEPQEARKITNVQGMIDFARRRS